MEDYLPQCGKLGKGGDYHVNMENLGSQVNTASYKKAAGRGHPSFK